MRIFILLILAVLTAGCGVFDNPGRVAKKDMPKNAPPDYKKGWGDGCESGLGSAYTNSWYKTFHSYHKDLRLLNNQLYVVGWDDGNRYCRAYAGQWVRWGYFDTTDGSLRDQNVPEQYTFAIPGWNGVTFDGNAGAAFGAENKDFFGSEEASDNFFGWKTNAGNFAVPGKSPFGDSASDN